MVEGTMNSHLDSKGLRELGEKLASKSKNIGQQVSDQVLSTMSEIPEVSRKMAKRLDRSAHANPWLHIGLVGAGSMALGYFMGRSMARSSNSVEFKNAGASTKNNMAGAATKVPTKSSSKNASEGPEEFFQH